MVKLDEEFKKSVTEQLGSARNNDAAKTALGLLFPRVERVVRTYLTSGGSDNFDRMTARRISQSDFAEAYFSLNPDPATWGRAEFERLIDEPAELALSKFKKRIEGAPPQHQSRLRRLFLELLDAAFRSKKELTQEWLDALVAISPYLLKEGDSTTRVLFPIENEDRLQWLIIAGLSKLAVHRRVKLLTLSIRRADDLTTLTDVIRQIAGDKNPEGARNQNRDAALGNRDDDVRSILLQKIRRRASTSIFWDQARPSRLLWFWWGCDLQTEVFAFTSKAMMTKKGLLGLLDAVVSTAVSSSEGKYEKVDNSWSKLVDLKKLQLKADALLRKSKDKDARRIATRFEKAISRGRA
jgi:hypothetical protein